MYVVRWNYTSSAADRRGPMSRSPTTYRLPTTRLDLHY